MSFLSVLNKSSVPEIRAFQNAADQWTPTIEGGTGDIGKVNVFMKLGE